MLAPLTALRGLAALAVMGFHFQPLIPGISLFDRGFLGVDLFFLLSGFILAHVYRGRPSGWAFFAARIARTYPLHLLTILLLLPWLGRVPAFSTDALACNLTMTQVLCGGAQSWNAVSWSLSAEWLCYLLFPLLLQPAARCPRAVAVLLLACVAVVLAGGPIHASDTYGLPALRRALPEFLAGLLLRRGYGEAWLAHAGWCLAAIVGLAGALALGAPDGVVLALFGAIILSAPYAAALEHRTLCWLGEISYALYMVHLPVGFAAIRILLALGIRNGGLLAAAATAASLLAATVTHHRIEQPARILLRRWLTRVPLPAPIA